MDLDVISVCPDTTIIQIVSRATVRYRAVFQPSAMHPVNVLVWQVLPENNVHNVARAIMRIPNVYVSVNVRRNMLYTFR